MVPDTNHNMKPASETSVLEKTHYPIEKSFLTLHPLHRSVGVLVINGVNKKANRREITKSVRQNTFQFGPCRVVEVYIILV